MLWVNLIMDSLASLSLATEAPTDDVLDLPPNLSDAPILSPLILTNITGNPIAVLSDRTLMLICRSMSLSIECYVFLDLSERLADGRSTASLYSGVQCLCLYAAL